VKIKLAYLAAAAFAVVAGVAAALGCPVFRNPGAYLTAGGAVGYFRHVIDVHRKH
jgi:hypothetical protein